MKRKRLIGSVAIGLAIVFAITGPLMVQAWNKKRAVDKTFAAFSSALINRDLEHAYSECASEFRAATTYEQFVNQQTDLEAAYGRLRSVEPGRTEVEGKGSPAIWVAAIYATFVYQRRTVTFAYEFHEEAGKWQLYGFKQL